MEYLLPARLNVWLALLAGALIPAAPACADVLVLKSDVPGIEKKSVLQDDAVLDVPDSKSVKVILKPQNVTKVIKGPYKGTAGDYVPSSGIAEKPETEFDPGAMATTPGPQSDDPYTNDAE
jgi:hypothetical protein